MENTLQQIDIKEVIRSKNPKLAKYMPKFLLRYLKKILWEEEINKIMKATEGMKAFEFSDYILKYLNVSFTVKGIENVPQKGGVVLACNHPLGGLDALAMISAFKSHREDFVFLVNDILLNIKNLRDVFVGVNKHGVNTRDGLLEMDQQFESDQAVFVFPAGLVSRKKNGVVKDLDWKKSFVTRAKEYNRDIIPVYISGHLSNFFYRLANIREKSGLKANIEMLYLLNEQFKLRNTKIEVVFGSNIPVESLRSTRIDKETANFIKGKVYQLSK